MAQQQRGAHHQFIMLTLSSSWRGSDSKDRFVSESTTELTPSWATTVASSTPTRTDLGNRGIRVLIDGPETDFPCLFVEGRVRQLCSCSSSDQQGRFNHLQGDTSEWRLEESGITASWGRNLAPILPGGVYTDYQERCGL